jgi:hypothetical protein
MQSPEVSSLAQRGPGVLSYHQREEREECLRIAKYFLCLSLGTCLWTAAYAAATSRDDALAIFKDATATYAKVCSAGPNDAVALPETMEDRAANAVTAAEDVLSKADDAELLKALLDYVAVSDCSADESRAFSLGAIFHKRPDALQKAIAALADKQRCELVGQLDWGWQNEIYDKKLDPKLKAEREARLAKLKSALPASCKEDKQ